MIRSISDVEYFVVHHSASPNHWAASKIRDVHLDLGWPDVGYHFLIERSGKLVRGRQLSKVGAHCLPHNQVSWGVCVIGDNTTPDSNATGRSWRSNNHSWVDEQWATLETLVKSVMILVPSIKVVGHREIGSTPTACPGIEGDELRKRLFGEEIRV